MCVFCYLYICDLFKHVCVCIGLYVLAHGCLIVFGNMYYIYICILCVNICASMCIIFNSVSVRVHHMCIYIYTCFLHLTLYVY